MTSQPLKRKNLGKRVGHSADMRAVNPPKPVQVSAGPNGRPLLVQQGKRGVRVVSVQNQWKIDDRWWTVNQVSRMYWTVELANGEVVTVFQDLIDGGWFEQHYTPPAEAGPPLHYTEGE